MKNLFVPYEIALKAKNAGFDEECLAYYREDAPENLKENIYEYITPYENNDVRNDKNIKPIFAPIYQQLIDWFREKHKIDICPITFDKTPGLYDVQIVNQNTKEEVALMLLLRCGWFKDYYEALTKAFEKAFELI